MRVSVKYNPFSKKTEIGFDKNICVTEQDRLYECLKKENLIQYGGKELIEAIAEKINTREAVLEFNGREIDYIDFSNCICEFNSENKTDFKGAFIENKKFDNIKEYISNIKEQIDIDEKADKDGLERQISDSVKRLADGEFKIAVISTMSSGKSTIINSLIGKKLLQSASKAATGTIFSIKDEDGIEGVYARVIDSHDNAISDWKEVSPKDLQEYNSDEMAEKIDRVEIKLNMPRIHSAMDSNVVIIDTPGVNNCKNKKHKEITLELIEENFDDSMILFVLDTVSLTSDDNNMILRHIADQIEKRGIDASDRFVFVINKIDALDGDTIENTVEEIRGYLEGVGIKSPKIFPMSARAAELGQLDISKIKNPKKRAMIENEIEQMKYISIPNFMAEEIQNSECDEDEWDDFEADDDGGDCSCKNGLDIIGSSSLSEKEKLDIKSEGEDLLKEDREQEALIVYSGLTAIEHYINSFLKKYYIPWKVSNCILDTNNSILKLKEDIEVEKRVKSQEITELREQIKELKQKESEIKEIEEKRMDLNVYGKINRLKVELKILIDDKKIFYFRHDKISEKEFNNAVKSTDSRVVNCVNSFLDRTEQEIHKAFYNAGLNNSGSTAYSSFSLEGKGVAVDRKINMMPTIAGTLVSLCIPGGIVTTLAGGAISAILSAKKTINNPRTHFSARYDDWCRNIVAEIERNLRSVESEYNKLTGDMFRIDEKIEDVINEINIKSEVKEILDIELVDINKRIIYLEYMSDILGEIFN